MQSRHTSHLMETAQVQMCGVLRQTAGMQSLAKQSSSQSLR